MTCTQALLGLFLFSPCQSGGGGLEAIETAVANPDRPPADVQRDADRKPAEVLSFFEIGPGMTVLDVFAGGGYYSEILNSVVGEHGKVLSHNNQAYLDFVGEELSLRFADERMNHTDRITAEDNALEIEDDSLDAALMILAYHDFFYANEQFGWLKVDETAFLDMLCGAMKPGAVLGVVDHVADHGGNVREVAKSLHRVDPQQVISDMTGSCFDLAKESNMLRNTTDNHSQPAIKPDLRGKTDRFVYKFKRR